MSVARGAIAMAVAACASLGAARSAAQEAPRPATSRAAPTSVGTAAGAASPWAALRAGIDSLLDDPSFANAHWGVVIVDPARGDTLYSRNAGKLFMPASNQKLLTGAVALTRLGAAHRWTTVLAAGGRLRNGTLAGDLLVAGSGDPSMSDAMRGDVRAAFDSLARALRDRGVRRVTGRLVHRGDAMPGDVYGFGWAHDDFGEAYSAPIDELTLNEGLARIVVRGTTVAHAARVEVFPVAGAVRVISRVRTIALPAAGRHAPRIELVDGAYVVHGTLLRGDSAVFPVAIREPGRAWLLALRAALARQGVRVQGGLARDTMPMTARDTLLVWQSPTLAEVLPWVEKPSQNQLAELLFRSLGAAFDSAGTERAGRRVVTAQLAQWGIDSTRVAVRDGSGLSRHDYVAPEAIVRVLDVMWRGRDSAVFRSALPVAGIDGTLERRMRGTAAQGRVQAKTGFVDKARSLSGYVTTAGGATLIFSMMSNNWTTPVRSVERVQDAIAVRLAQLPLAALADADRR